MTQDERRAQWRRGTNKYSRTQRGVAAQIRKNHGLGLEESVEWARTLMADDTRCYICGVPGWKLRKMKAWKHGGFQMNRRLSLDHVSPGVTDGNYRPLCTSCNAVRGHARLHDHEVLYIMRKWYLSIYALKNVPWLNDVVIDGICLGGIPELPGRARRLADFTNHDDPETRDL